MNHKLLSLILLLLLASCTITKRKYLPGYAVNWVHKTPKIMGASSAGKQNGIMANAPGLLPIKIASTQVVALPPFKGLQGHQGLFPLPATCQKLMPAIYRGTPANLQIPPYLQTQCNGLKTGFVINPVDSVNNKRVVCEEANTSLLMGILSVILSIIAFVPFIILLFSSNTAGLGFLWIVVLLLLAGHYVAAILAIVYGAKADKKMNSEPLKYTGRSKAIVGIILGVLGIL